MKKPSRSASYTPTALDLAWARQMVHMLGEGGILAYPSTRVIYSVSHEHKTITLQNPDALLDFNSFVIHYQTIDVFDAIGYRVLPPKDESKVG